MHVHARAAPNSRTRARNAPKARTAGGGARTRTHAYTRTDPPANPPAQYGYKCACAHAPTCARAPIHQPRQWLGGRSATFRVRHQPPHAPRSAMFKFDRSGRRAAALALLVAGTVTVTHADRAGPDTGADCISSSSVLIVTHTLSASSDARSQTDVIIDVRSREARDGRSLELVRRNISSNRLL